MQKRIGRIEDGSAEVRSFHPLLVPGLLQTKDYARAVFSSGGDLAVDQIEDALAARLERAVVLDDASRTFTAVLTAGTLRWPIGSFAIMADQLAHVSTMSRRPNIQIGVITGNAPVDIAPVHGFDLFDERAALVGIETATGFMTDPRDVAAYRKLFHDLQRLAVFGDEARAELEHVVEFYRSRQT